MKSHNDAVTPFGNLFIIYFYHLEHSILIKAHHAQLSHLYESVFLVRFLVMVYGNWYDAILNALNMPIVLWMSLNPTWGKVVKNQVYNSDVCSGWFDSSYGGEAKNPDGTEREMPVLETLRRLDEIVRW